MEVIYKKACFVDIYKSIIVLEGYISNVVITNPKY